MSDAGIDWNALRVFAETARRGSLSAAARALGISQPTAGRSVKALEQSLGLDLFLRSPRGLELTDSGAELLEQASAMSRAAARLSLIAEGRSEAVAGTVRITASQVVANYTLPPVIAALRRAEPDIDIELVSSNATDNLLRREADIAVRMYRPTQSGVIARKVCDVPIGAFAGTGYLARAGVPRTIADLEQHDVIGYDTADDILRGFRDLGADVDRDFFKVRCDDQVACWNLVLADAGIGFIHCRIGAGDTRVTQVLTDVSLPVLPMWLTSHAELRTSRRVRRVYDFLADALVDQST